MKSLTRIVASVSTAALMLVASCRGVSPPSASRASVPVSPASATSPAPPASTSGTNAQVQGVDEADIVKNAFRGWPSRDSPS